MTASRDRGQADYGRQDRAYLTFEEFFTENWPRLIRFLRTQSANTAWAEDVASYAMNVVCDKWDKLFMERPVQYMNKVATRKLQHLEARAREHCLPADDLASSDYYLRLAAAEDPWIEVHFDLIAATRALPRCQRLVIGLHFFKDCTLAEVAKIMGISEGAVKKHLSRGLEGLRQTLGVHPAPKTRRRRVPA